MVVTLTARRPPQAASAKCNGCHSGNGIAIEEAIVTLRRQAAEQLG